MLIDDGEVSEKERTKAGTQPESGWSNWSGNQSAPSARVIQPRGEAELRELLERGAGPIRVVGSGHSFTPIVATTGTVINLDRMGGVISVDPVAQTAVVRGGARLKQISEELETHGFAFRNLGDINVQSFAGAAATGTHGTGETFGCLSSEIIAVRLMTADGSILEGSLDSNPDLVKAAQVSVGALGILLEATINVCPKYRLHRQTFVESIETILDAADERWASNRNYEFFYLPFSGKGMNIFHNQTDAAPTVREPSQDEEVLAAIRSVRDRFKWSSVLRNKVLGAGLRNTTGEDVIGTSWKLLASPRETLFNEIEYHLPVDTGLQAFKDVVSYIERSRKEVFFPIEVRKTAGDEGWLSPFQGAPRISVAVHAAADDPYDWFFDHIEPIFRAAGGRPHWGKLHSLNSSDCAEVYPDFGRFVELRKQLDPDCLFMTPALAAYWGEA